MSLVESVTLTMSLKNVEVESFGLHAAGGRSSEAQHGWYEKKGEHLETGEWSRVKKSINWCPRTASLPGRGRDKRAFIHV